MEKQRKKGYSFPKIGDYKSAANYAITKFWKQAPTAGNISTTMPFVYSSLEEMTWLAINQLEGVPTRSDGAYMVNFPDGSVLKFEHDFNQITIHTLNN